VAVNTDVAQCLIGKLAAAGLAQGLQYQIVGAADAQTRSPACPVAGLLSRRER
jgi:hypothetical protein